MQLILSSQSPRRHTLLSQLGYRFETHVPHISEHLDLLDLEPSLLELARLKALDARKKFSSGLSIGCDTVVIIDGQVLGKPRDTEAARTMLRQLSGRTHQVKSALALVKLDNGQSKSDLETTHVTFRTLSEQDIETYITGPEPYDKAGAYAAQGQGTVFIACVSGCLNNVIGFPVVLFLRLLSQFKD